MSESKLIQHMASITLIDEKRCNEKYPDYFLPVARGCNLLAHHIYALASLGSRSIWVISNDIIQESVANDIGDFVPDPDSFDLGNYAQIYKQMIPVFYLNIPASSKTASLFRARKLISLQSGRVSSFLLPQKWFFSYSDTVFSLPLMSSLKRSAVSDNNESISIYDYFGRLVGLLLTNEDSVLMKKMLAENNELSLISMASNLSNLRRIDSSDCFSIRSIDDFCTLCRSDHHLFEYPNKFKEFKKRTSYGFELDFVGKDTQIHVREKK